MKCMLSKAEISERMEQVGKPLDEPYMLVDDLGLFDDCVFDSYELYKTTISAAIKCEGDLELNALGALIERWYKIDGIEEETEEEIVEYKALLFLRQYCD